MRPSIDCTILPELKEGKISEALQTEAQMAEIQLQACGLVAYDPWDGVLGINSQSMEGLTVRILPTSLFILPLQLR